MLKLNASLLIISGKILRNYTKCIPMSLSSLRHSHYEVQRSNLPFKEFSTPHFVSLVDSVRDLGFHEEEIKLAIQVQPDLLKKSTSVFSSILGSLVDCGLEKKDVLSIIKKWPSVLELKKSELDQNIQAWFSCQLGDEYIFDIFKTHPSVLQVNRSTVLRRIKQYQTFFETKKGVGKLLLLAPNAIDEDWPELREKLNYLDELCTGKSDIIKSGVLAHSALHIIKRHEFLIRAGIYKRPGKEYIKKLSMNPKLTNIVNTSDEKFALKVAGLSMLEYEVFSDMFEKEYNEAKNTEEDSEDEESDSYFQHKRKPSRR